MKGKTKTVAIVVTVQSKGVLLMAGPVQHFMTNDETVGDFADMLRDPRVRESQRARPRDWIDSAAQGLRDLLGDDGDEDDDGDEYEDEDSTGVTGGDGGDGDGE